MKHLGDFQHLLFSVLSFRLRKKNKQKKNVDLKKNKVLEDDKPYLLRILAVSIATSRFPAPAASGDGRR